MISYTEIRGSSTSLFRVHLDGKPVGEIRKGPGGFYYKPTGRDPGDNFPTIKQVKQSLES